MNAVPVHVNLFCIQEENQEGVQLSSNRTSLYKLPKLATLLPQQHLQRILPSFSNSRSHSFKNDLNTIEELIIKIRFWWMHSCIPDITGWTLFSIIVIPRRYANLATAFLISTLSVKMLENSFLVAKIMPAQSIPIRRLSTHVTITEYFAALGCADPSSLETLTLRERKRRQF